MDARCFDRLAQKLAAGETRRGFLHLLAALPLVGVLIGLLNDEGAGKRRRKARGHVGQENHKHEGRRRKHANHHKKQKKHCRAESPAETCAGRCGTVQNNCRKSVDCGSCECASHCPACQICNASNGQCEPDTAVNGESCGPGRICADGLCVSCTPRTCASVDAECGSIADGCGNPLDCGVCQNPRPICTANRCVTCEDASECIAAGLGDLCCAGQCLSGVCCAAADCLPAGDTCAGNQCRCGGAATCAGDAPDCCGGACTNTDTDDSNCGGCGIDCAADQRCWDGVCVCGDVCPSGCQFDSVPAAIAAAPSGATILVCAGDYPTSIALLRDVTIRGAGAALTTLRALPNDRIFDSVPGRQFQIEALTITGGNALNGGGIFNRGTMTLTGVNVTGNVAEGPGAGVGGGIVNNQGTLLLDDSHVTLNRAGSRGGGIATFGGSVTLTNGSTVTNNTPDNCEPPGTIPGCVEGPAA